MSKLKEFIKSMPNSPGVYKYFDKNGNLIYIGKAKDLKKRVSSYFNKIHYESKKLETLVAQINHIEFTLVETEMDALLLENVLIKKHQPKYNAALKDDKSYPYICIKKEAFQRVFSTRNPVYDGSEFFGPYVSLNTMNTILEFIAEMYPLRNCNLNLSAKNIEVKKFQVCLEFHIGNCKGPCVGKQSFEDYEESIKQIKNILNGQLRDVQKQLQVQMKIAADKLKFEQAALLKKKIESLKRYQGKSIIVSQNIRNVDVFSIVTDESFSFINYLRVANGMIVQTNSYEAKKRLDESDVDLLSLAIAEVRMKYNSTAKEIITPIKLDWTDKNIKITVPKTGDKKQLLDLSMKNVLYFKREKLNQYEKLNPGVKSERILSQMMQDLRLKTLPAHIECFDNSNLQGTNPVSACVVFKDAKPSKKDYRIFNVKTVEGPNDFATMEEVVYRRYKRVLEENEPIPDLIIIDGGKGQLSAATTSLKKLNLYGKVAILGIAKRLEELFFPNDEIPLYIDKKSETLKLIQQLRDEAHRFGIEHHRKRRQKASINTEIEAINGIGPETSRQLLSKFKSIKKLGEAKLEEIAEIVGNSKAQILWKYFND